jgi:hypothetical protein
VALLWTAIIFLGANAYGAFWLLTKLAGPLGLATYDPLYVIPLSLGLAAIGLILGLALAKPVAQAFFLVCSYFTFLAVPVAFASQIFGDRAFTWVKLAAIPNIQAQNFIWAAGIALLVHGIMSRKFYRFFRHDALAIRMFTNPSWTGRDWLFMGQDLRMVIFIALWFGVVYAKVVTHNVTDAFAAQSAPAEYSTIDQVTIVAAQTVTASKPMPVNFNKIESGELEPTAETPPQEIAGFQFAADLRQATVTSGNFGGFRLDLRSGAVNVPDPMKLVTAPRHKLARRLSPDQNLYLNWAGDLIDLNDGRRKRPPFLGKRVEPVFFTHDGKAVVAYDDAEKSIRAVPLSGGEGPLWEIPLSHTPLDEKPAAPDAASGTMRIVANGEPAPNQLSMIVGTKIYYLIDFVETDLTKIDREVIAFHAAYSTEGDLVAFTSRTESQAVDGQLLTLITKETAPVKWKGRVLYLSSHQDLAITRMQNKITAWRVSKPEEISWTVDLPVNSKTAPAAVSADGKFLITFDADKYSWIPVGLGAPPAFKSFPAKYRNSPAGYFRNDQFGHLMAHVYGSWATVFWLKFPNGDGFNSLTADFHPYMGP